MEVSGRHGIVVNVVEVVDGLKIDGGVVCSFFSFIFDLLKLFRGCSCHDRLGGDGCEDGLFRGDEPLEVRSQSGVRCHCELYLPASDVDRSGSVFIQQLLQIATARRDGDQFNRWNLRKALRPNFGFFQLSRPGQRDDLDTDVGKDGASAGILTRQQSRVSQNILPVF